MQISTSDVSSFIPFRQFILLSVMAWDAYAAMVLAVFFMAIIVAATIAVLREAAILDERMVSVLYVLFIITCYSCNRAPALLSRTPSSAQPCRVKGTSKFRFHLQDSGSFRLISQLFSLFAF